MTHQDAFPIQRQRMINHLLKPHKICDPRVLQAMAEVPRHEFLSARQADLAYAEQKHAIGYGQMMASPLMIAQMLQMLHFTGTENILEVGTGSGYVTALLMQLGAYVFSLERILPLAEDAASRWQDLRIHNVDLHIGDGSQGLPDMAAFDVILLTASVPRIPRPLALQLNPHSGRMIVPIEVNHQQKLKLVRRRGQKWYVRTMGESHFLPLIGRFGKKPAADV